MWAHPEDVKKINRKAKFISQAFSLKFNALSQI